MIFHTSSKQQVAYIANKAIFSRYNHACSLRKCHKLHLLSKYLRLHQNNRKKNLGAEKIFTISKVYKKNNKRTILVLACRHRIHPKCVKSHLYFFKIIPVVLLPDPDSQTWPTAREARVNSLQGAQNFRLRHCLKEDLIFISITLGYYNSTRFYSDITDTRENVPHATPSTVHLCTSSERPSHDLPSCSGAVLLQSLDRAISPVPQVTVHGVQSYQLDHWPSTAAAVVHK